MTIYQGKIEYLNNIKDEKNQSKSKPFGSVLEPGPYQKPLSIAIPPLNSGILIKHTVDRYTPELCIPNIYKRLSIQI